MDRLKSLTFKVDVFVGTDVRDAACDMCILADRLGLLIEAEFNGIRLWARPGDNPLKLVAAFHKQLENRSPYKIAEARDV